jgi:glycogen phosphorylase
MQPGEQTVRGPRRRNARRHGAGRDAAAVLVRGADGAPLRVTVPIFETEVVAQIWRVAVGRVPLFLLDADLPDNGRLDRWITSQLYVADAVTRLSQYVLLGVGGVRALAALGIEPGVVHLNEGHAAFAVLELARAELARGASLEAALAAARERTVFTTHTPVAAGNETYSSEEVTRAIGGLARELAADPEDLVGLGRFRPEDRNEPFGMTTLSPRRQSTSERRGGQAGGPGHVSLQGRPLCDGASRVPARVRPGDGRVACARL